MTQSTIARESFNTIIGVNTITLIKQLQHCNSVWNFMMSPLILYSLKNQFTKTLLIRDSIIAALLRYLKVWKRCFTPFKALTFEIGGDRVENVLWWTKNLLIPPSLKNVVVFCGTNNPFTNSPVDIADCIVNIGSCLCEKFSSVNVFVFGSIPRDESWHVNRVLIKNVFRILKYLCLKHYFSYIDQSNGWTLANGDLDLSLFFRDSLHLVEEGNVKLAKLFINSITLTNNMCFIKHW